MSTLHLNLYSVHSRTIEARCLPPNHQCDWALQSPSLRTVCRWLATATSSSRQGRERAHSVTKKPLHSTVDGTPLVSRGDILPVADLVALTNMADATVSTPSTSRTTCPRRDVVVKMPVSGLRRPAAGNLWQWGANRATADNFGTRSAVGDDCRPKTPKKRAKNLLSKTIFPIVFWSVLHSVEFNIASPRCVSAEEVDES